MIAILQEKAVDFTFTEVFPIIPIKCTESGQVVPPGDEVIIYFGTRALPVRLKPISALFTGEAPPPDFAQGPTDEYLNFFCLIERTATEYCSIAGCVERDEEFERLYRLLRRRPDGGDGNPLFAYLQAAVRFYMSLKDVSQGEFEAVANRLAKSARRAAVGYASANYLALIQHTLP